MELTKWDPFREMEDLFDHYSRNLRHPHRSRHHMMAPGDWVPRVDICETDAAFVIQLEVPGLEKKDIKVSVDGGILTVQGERRQEKKEKEEDTKYHRIERFYGSFTRSFALPDNVDETKIDAVFKDGVLNLQVPKTETAKPKTIDIEVH